MTEHRAASAASATGRCHPKWLVSDEWRIGLNPSGLIIRRSSPARPTITIYGCSTIIHATGTSAVIVVFMKIVMDFALKSGTAARAYVPGGMNP